MQSGPNGPPDGVRIPLCAGLTIVTAVQRREGDYESIKRVTSVTGQAVTLSYSTQIPQGSHIHDVLASRTVLAEDLRGATLYIIDEPTAGLHPADTDRLMVQLEALVQAGNSVILAEHDLRVIAQADWIIDMGPGAGDRGGQVVACGTPHSIVKNGISRTAPPAVAAKARPPMNAAMNPLPPSATEAA